MMRMDYEYGYGYIRAIWCFCMFCKQVLDTLPLG